MAGGEGIGIPWGGDRCPAESREAGGLTRAVAHLAAECLLLMPFQKIPIGPPISTTRVMDSLAMQITPQKEPVVDPVLPTPAVWDDVCGFKRR